MGLFSRVIEMIDEVDIHRIETPSASTVPSPDSSLSDIPKHFQRQLSRRGSDSNVLVFSRSDSFAKEGVLRSQRSRRTVTATGQSGGGDLPPMPLSHDASRRSMQRVPSFTDDMLGFNQFQPSFAYDGTGAASFARNQPLFRFDHVTIETPDRHGTPHVLVSNLVLVVRPHQNVVILGPNGCGKTSLFRTLAGVWQPAAGIVTTFTKNLMYLPQRPYFCEGTVMDQIIYPDIFRDYSTREQAKSQEKAVDALRRVQLLDNFPDLFRYSADWYGVLSGGESQRLSFARVLYHKPQLVLLDEATAAIAADSQEIFFQQMKILGITFMSIVHNMQLVRYHSHVLRISGDGRGSWSYGLSKIHNDSGSQTRRSSAIGMAPPSVSATVERTGFSADSSVRGAAGLFGPRFLTRSNSFSADADHPDQAAGGMRYHASDIYADSLQRPHNPLSSFSSMTSLSNAADLGPSLTPRERSRRNSLDPLSMTKQLSGASSKPLTSHSAGSELVSDREKKTESTGGSVKTGKLKRLKTAE